MIIIGPHLSIAKGYTLAAREASSIGANTFQFFTRNPRGGSIKALDLEDLEAFKAHLDVHQFGPLLAHAPYTYNLCSDKETVRQFAIQAFIEDLQRLAHTPCTLYNFHPGSHVGQGEEKGMELIIEALDAIIDPNSLIMLLLEGMSGKGSEIGYRFEQLAEIRSRVRYPDKLGVCLDTCHLYSAGYDIVSDLDGVLREFDEKIGLSVLKAIHLNDSKVPFDSRKDRHETIGNGTIGLEALSRVINHPLLKDLPFFLETPNEVPDYQLEIELLKAHRK